MLKRLLILTIIPLALLLNGEFVYSDQYSNEAIRNLVEIQGSDDFLPLVVSPQMRGKIILIAKDINILEDLNIPADRILKFIPGGRLVIATGKSVIINGPLEAGLFQIFSGSGKIAFGLNSVTEVYPQWWHADPTGKFDSTAAINAALWAVGWYKHKNPYLSYSFNPGGGTVKLPKGQYKVTGSLKFAGSTTINGDGYSTLIMFSPLVPETDLFVADNNRWTANSFMEDVTIKNLAISGDYPRKNYGRYAINFSQCHRTKLENVLINFTRYGAYYKDGYYHIISSCFFRDNELHLFVDKGGGPIECIQSQFTFSKKFLAENYPQYMIRLHGQTTFSGCSFEPKDKLSPSGGCIYNEKNHAILNGCYAESNYPLVIENISQAHYGQTVISGGHLYASPLLKFENFDFTKPETYKYAVQYNSPVLLEAGSAKIADLNPNESMIHGSCNYVLSREHGKTIFDTSPVGRFNNQGSFKIEHAGDGGKTSFAIEPIPEDKLTNYFNRRIWVALVAKKEGQYKDWNFKIFQSGYPSQYKQALKKVDYGNGWGLYVADLQLIPGLGSLNADLNMTSQEPATTWIAHLKFYLDGYEPIPYADYNKILRANNSPTKGAWEIGDRVYKAEPDPQAEQGWVCLRKNISKLRQPAGESNSITVTSTLGMAKGDPIQVSLDDGTLEETMIKDIQNSETIILASVLKGKASQGNQVVSFTWKGFYLSWR